MQKSAGHFPAADPDLLYLLMDGANFDARTFVDNVKFENFRRNYTGAIEACSNNMLFT